MIWQFKAFWLITLASILSDSSKYEEYKRKENEHGQIILKKEEIAEIDKRSIKYEKIKRETRALSSDDDCKIVERKPTKAEDSASSREKRNYDERSIQGREKYKSEYKREDECEHNRVSSYNDKETLKGRDNTRDYDGYSRREASNTNDKYRDGQSSKDRAEERNKDYQKDSFRRDRTKDSEKYRERSRDRYKSKYCNDAEQTRDSNKGYTSGQRRDYRDKDYEERKSRHVKPTTSDESDNEDYREPKKISKNKHKKKKSKKSKKSKSKYRESTASDSSTSSSSSASDSEEERHKKHKKKTKKSKKERERSRSRGRR